MTALLGPAPPEFLGRSEETGKYWSEDGELINIPSNENKLSRLVIRHLEGPTGMSLETLVTTLGGEDKA